MIQLIEDSSSGFWDNLLRAGLAIGIGLLVWLVVHHFIRLVVKHSEAVGTPLEHRTLRWAAPVLRNIDPVLRALDTERRVQRARTIGSLLNSILTTVVAVVTGFYVLLAFHVNIAPLLASVGVLGIAIGFGAQQLIRDFLAGVFITIEDQYGIGDVIQTSEVTGTVEYLGLRITRVMAEDGTLWYLRNGEILRLGNRSKGNYVAPVEEPAATPAGTPAAAGPTPSSAPGTQEPTSASD
ncbi:mechanosensitive ion channel family protein [Arthrobacter sp. GMC3]|uniref:mechanosensitive ion channel family protein n=1 Tax=Arthrobacter sp. GMC3 TaxID=2058894 RepID=UPI000CE404C2|nr:mechanosensitive ion channel domain-containing protein [Arthrobacter sp. GMC3]